MFQWSSGWTDSLVQMDQAEVSLSRCLFLLQVIYLVTFTAKKIHEFNTIWGQETMMEYDVNMKEVIDFSLRDRAPKLQKDVAHVMGGEKIMTFLVTVIVSIFPNTCPVSRCLRVIFFLFCTNNIYLGFSLFITYYFPTSFSCLRRI